jgi:hypothetical protein
MQHHELHLGWRIEASMKNIERQHHSCTDLESNNWQHNKLQKDLKWLSAATSCRRLAKRYEAANAVMITTA